MYGRSEHERSVSLKHHTVFTVDIGASGTPLLMHSGGLAATFIHLHKTL